MGPVTLTGKLWSTEIPLYTVPFLSMSDIVIKKRTRPNTRRREIEEDNTPEEEPASDEEAGQPKLT